MDIPESNEPTDPLRVIFSFAAASDRSSSELLMAERRNTTPPFEEEAPPFANTDAAEAFETE